MTLIAIAFLVFISGVYAERYFQKKYSRKNPVYSNEGWLPIETFPEDEKNFLVTDGEIVEHDFMPGYDKNGNMVFSMFPKRIATHWRKFPPPPKSK